MQQLRISKDLRLPLDAVTRRMAILAMSGAGKSNLAVVLAEAMFEAGVPWVAIDPKGDWWGIRSNQTGKGPGLPIPIFGGLHGDVPLEPTAGHMIADLIVSQRLTCVLDVSEFPDRQGMWSFLHDLGDSLLRKNRQALHLFLEEADEYLPQRPGEKGNLLKCKGVWQRVVKRGRFRGLGSTQITQRSASLDKDTLYQAEVLFALRVAGKGDKDAVTGWVEHHNAAAEIVASLPTLADGEGWISSPAYLKTTKRLQFDRRHTFDSGATPVLLKGTVRPATLADIDLAVIQTKMAATIEKAKADDPIELRKQITNLKRQLSAKTPAPAPVAKPKVEIQVKEKKVVIAKEVTRLEALVKKGEELAKLATTNVAEITTASAKVAALLTEAKEVNAQELQQAPVAPPALPLSSIRKATGAVAVGSAAPVSRRVSVQTSHTNGNESSTLTAPEQRVLNALAWWEAIDVKQPDKGQVGFIAGYRVGKNVGGTYGNILGRLRSAGLIEYPGAGTAELTDAGRAIARTPDELPSTTALHEAIYKRLDNPESRVLNVIIESYPEKLSKKEAGQRAGYTVGDNVGGTFGNILGRLRSLGLIGYPTPGCVVALPVLFIE